MQLDTSYEVPFSWNNTENIWLFNLSYLANEFSKANQESLLTLRKIAMSIVFVANNKFSHKNWNFRKLNIHHHELEYFLILNRLSSEIGSDFRWM